MSNINNTNSDNLVTIGKHYLSEPKNKTSAVRNDDVIDPDKRNSRTFATTRIFSYLTLLYFNEYSLNILPCTKINNNFSNPLASHSSVNVITVPSKIWRKKPVNKYNPIVCDKNVYAFKSFDKSMKHSLHLRIILVSVQFCWINICRSIY